MVTRSRESRLTSAFLRLSDTLAAGIDEAIIGRVLVEECVSLLDVEEAGLMLADTGNILRSALSTSHGVALVDGVQLEHGAGPSLQSFQTGTEFSVPNLDLLDAWPHLRDAARVHGFRAVHAIPLQRHDEAIGSLTLWSTSVGALARRDADAARALAEVATIAMLQVRLMRERELVATQLQHALDSRVVIEQAKGILSHVGAIDVKDAAEAIRSYARAKSIRMNDVAASIIDHTLEAETILSGPMPAVRVEKLRDRQSAGAR